jgi:hypothetical protein
MQFLDNMQADDAGKIRQARIASLMMRLGGTTPPARALVGSMIKKGETKPELFQNQALLKWNAILKGELIERSFRGTSPEDALKTATLVRFTDGILGEFRFWEELKATYKADETSASVDSELTLLLNRPYQLQKWLGNPFFGAYDHLTFIRAVRDKTLMVGRLDGPTPQLAKRLVDDALNVEKTGLEGVFYIDARGGSKGRVVPEATGGMTLTWSACTTLSRTEPA